MTEDFPLPSGRVLQVGGLAPELAEILAAHYGATVLPEPRLRPAFLAEHADEIVVAVTSGGVGVKADLIEALPKLGAIVNFGVGYDTTDVAAARARGIGVSNTPDVLNDCVADTALGLLLDVFRRFPAADRFVRRGDWLRGGFPLAREFSGSRVGIIGLGRIGRAVARRLDAFDVRVAYHNRTPVEGVAYEYVDSPVELARRCDALVVAATGGPGTRGLVSREVLEALGPGYLVNVSRGSVVDQDALVELLVAGRLGGAGLDVYAGEPAVPEALLTMDDVVLLPHVGSATVETRQAMVDLVISNLDQYLRDGSLRTPVPA